MHSARTGARSAARLGLLAGTALVLSAASAAAQLAPMSPPGAFSTPGSMPKPPTVTAPSDGGSRFHNPSAPSATVQPRREQQALPSRPANAEIPSSPAAVGAPSQPATAQPSAPAARTQPTAPPAAVAAPPAPRVEPAPRPTAAAPASDPAVSDALRQLVAGRAIERITSRKSERDAIATLYQKGRNHQPLWIASGGPSERAKAAIEFLRGVDADGLDPADYQAPNFNAASPEAIAEAELRFTATVLSYARHALNGRVHFSRVSPNIDYKLAFDENDVLNRLAGSNDVARTLASFQPQQPAYKALKAKLAEFRQQPAETGPAPIASGPVLRLTRDRNGRTLVMSDPRVPQLRERLGVKPEQNTHYNAALASAVAGFQKSRGLQPNGQLTTATIEALNGPSRQKRLDAILATMERWRWMPRDLGRTHVALNIPDYHLRVMHNGQQVWMTRVVVGKPTHATPLITETMKYITVNPIWNVPQSIIHQEIMPLYQSTDRQIFERMGLKVERRQNGEIRVFQPPGDRNALGRLRFNFPNKFLVYQHDTPERQYFAHSRRAHSHGCMRVQDPLKYAEVLLTYGAPRGNHTQASLSRMFGDEERQIDFQHHIPVHVSYQTAFVDDAGKLVFREDIYDLDKALLAQLRGAERAVADVIMERPADPNYQPTPDDAKRLQSVARGGVPNPFAVFEQLFR
ncbi:MAG: murein L,D-transpeptidase [Alphaproteobacteria bacterium]|nr:murein L,D-transpeptidase [Alphaproteobacteria bacterium]